MTTYSIRHGKSPQIRRALNLRLLLGSLLIAGIIAPTVYLLHKYQVERLDDELLALATRFESDQEWSKAAAYIYRYLRQNPSDAPQWKHLAETYEKSVGGSPTRLARAVQHYATALVLAERPQESGGLAQQDIDQMRCRRAELLIELGTQEPARFRQAGVEARQVHRTEGELTTTNSATDEDASSVASANYASAWRSLALAQIGLIRSGIEAAVGLETRTGITTSASPAQTVGEEANRSFPRIDQALERARQLNPGDISLARMLAGIYRERDADAFVSDRVRALDGLRRNELADRVMDDVVAHRNDDATAYLARYYYRMEYTPLDVVSRESPDAKGLIQDSDLSRAMELAPVSTPVLFAVARYARHRADVVRERPIRGATRESYLQEAIRHYQQILKTEPDNELAYRELGLAQMAGGDSATALATWKRGLDRAALADSVLLRAELVRGYLAHGDVDRAKLAMGSLDDSVQRASPRLQRESRSLLRLEQQLLHARMSFAEQDFKRATTQLEGFLAAEQLVGDELFQAQLMLFRGYVALQRWDEALGAFRAAARRIAQGNSVALAGAVQSLLDVGRAADAARCCGYALAEPALAPTGVAELCYLLAEARFRTQLALPVSHRNWTLFHQSLKDVELAGKSHLTNPWRIDLLAVTATLAAQPITQPTDPSMRQRLLERLRTAHSEYADVRPLLQRLIVLFEQLGSPSDADQALEAFVQAASISGQSQEGVLARAGLLTLRKQYTEARAVLIAALDSSELTDLQRTAFEGGLVDIESAAGDLPAALSHALRLAEIGPPSLQLAAQIVELALSSGNEKVARDWQGRLGKLPGNGELLADYFQARQLLSMGSGGSSLAAAETLQQQLEAKLPHWPAAQTLKGLILQRKGLLPDAAAALQQAIALGDRSVQTFGSLIAILFETGQGETAARYLEEANYLGPGAQGTVQLLDMAAAARLGDVDRALEAARRHVNQNAHDFAAHLSLGFLLLANNQPLEAETELVKAVEIAPTNVRAYDGLFHFSISNRQVDRALEVLQKMAERAKLTDVQREFVLAQGYGRVSEIASDESRPELRAKAITHYRQARKLNPEWAEIRLFMAEFLMQDAADAAESERMLRQMIQEGVEVDRARRMLANLLASDPARLQEALTLLDQTGRTGGGTDQRLKAIVLLRNGGIPNLLTARHDLEQLVDQSPSSADADRLLLANLYEYLGEVPLAQKQYEKLVDRPRPAAAHVAAYVELLLKMDNLGGAATWLDRLDQLAPDSFATARLRAKWFGASGEREKAHLVIDKYAQRERTKVVSYPQRNAELARSVGELYASLELHQHARTWFRELATLDDSRGYAEQALSWAKEGKIKEAVTVCASSAQKDPSAAPAVALARAIIASPINKFECPEAEPLLATALEKHGENVDLLFSLATLRHVQQRFKEADELYRRVLEINSNHVLALNNLAHIRAEQPGRESEALQYVDRALDHAGPQSAAYLWDTKAVILLGQGQADQALPLLERATAVPQADPRHYFHLSVAQLRSGQAELARRSYDIAVRRKFDAQILTASDRQMLEQLKVGLSATNGNSGSRKKL